VAGYGAAMDGGALLTDPDPSGEGAARAMQAALASAGCAVEEVDCIKAHGTSTRANDRMETRAIRRVFGARAERIPVTAPKSMLGHSLAAAGAVEAAAALGILAREAIPPTINYSTADPECDLDYVPNQARPARVDTLLLNSFGMGGHNAALVIRRAA
jgi:3-oxoacyl-[acyl-carrier-protein] synthase II